MIVQVFINSNLCSIAVPKTVNVQRIIAHYMVVTMALAMCDLNLFSIKSENSGLLSQLVTNHTFHMYLLFQARGIFKKQCTKK